LRCFQARSEGSVELAGSGKAGYAFGLATRVSQEVPGHQHSTVGLQRGSGHSEGAPWARAQFNIEGGIGRAVGVQSGDGTVDVAVSIVHFVVGNYLAVRLQG